VLPLGELALLRPDQLDAALAEERGICLRRRVLPHAYVHGRGGKHGAADGEDRLRQDVVGESVGELGERVRRERGDDEQVGVREVRIEVARRLSAGERLERVRGHEALRVRGEQRRDLVAVLDEQPQELARLVGGDSAGHTEENPSHEGLAARRATSRRP
jgi:hypothetical protein